MYFSRAILDVEQVPAATLGRLVQGDQYLGHQLLWGLFSTGEGEDRKQPRPFVFRCMEDANRPTFYVVSDREPTDRDGYWTIGCKPYEPRIQSGMRLHFDLRANPVRREQGANGQRRHDVVMDAKKHRQAADEEVVPGEIEHKAGMYWLGARAQRLGFSLSEHGFSACGYQQHVIHKGSGKPIRFSSLDMQGILEVTDPERFRQTLSRGIGPSKSFGCGLLLVRPV